MKLRQSIILTGALLLFGTSAYALESGETPFKAKGNKQASQRAPFLINGLMPHLTKMVKINWDDPVFNLTQEQKRKLLQVRKETMRGVMDLKPKINTLERKIAVRSASGESVEAIMPQVKRLATLKAKATKIHLECIYNTKLILTKEQIAFLLK